MKYWTSTKLRNGRNPLPPSNNYHQVFHLLKRTGLDDLEVLFMLPSSANWKYFPMKTSTCCSYCARLIYTVLINAVYTMLMNAVKHSGPYHNGGIFRSYAHKFNIRGHRQVPVVSVKNLVYYESSYEHNNKACVA